MTGYTLSPDFPVSPGAYQTIFGGNGNAFVSILNTLAPPGMGQGLPYSTYFGGSGGEVAYDLHQDSAGRLYFGGYTLSPNLPVTANALAPSSVGGSIDGFVAVLDHRRVPSARMRWCIRAILTGPGMQVVYGVDVDTSGRLCDRYHHLRRVSERQTSQHFRSEDQRVRDAVHAAIIRHRRSRPPSFRDRPHDQ